MVTLDLAIRTLFIEFQETIFKRFELEKEHDKQWTFISKKIKGKKYWYLQRYVDGKAFQQYYAPSNSQNDSKVILKRNELNAKKKLLKQLILDEQKRVSMLRRVGLPSLDFFTARIIEEFSKSFLTYKDGILIGSLAFSAYSGMFGSIFEKQSLKTMDIDIAFDPIEMIAGAESINISELLQKIDSRFSAVPPLSHKYLPHSFIGPQGIRIDILAPLIGKPAKNIKIRKIVGASAEPLRFLDFLIYNPVSGVLLGPRKGTPVTIPHPARYAIHKLIVTSYRSVTEMAKRSKDILQAQQLIQVCAQEYPAELIQTYNEAVRRGKKWKLAINNAMQLLSLETKETLNKLL